MQARIIELKDGEMYLEVDEQLRFRTKYVASRDLIGMCVFDRVDFTFMPSFHSPCIKIRSVFHKFSSDAHGQT